MLGLGGVDETNQPVDPCRFRVFIVYDVVHMPYSRLDCKVAGDFLTRLLFTLMIVSVLLWAYCELAYASRDLLTMLSLKRVAIAS